jgi:hypothetical protein
MKSGVIFICAGLAAGVVWLVFELAPLFLNSKIERLGEKNLPKILVENGNIIHCRMKADDFRFPLPPGTQAFDPVINSGGFDTVEGSVEARFESSNHITAAEYLRILGKVQEGGDVSPQTTPQGFRIKFRYFGDR